MKKIIPLLAMLVSLSPAQQRGTSSRVAIFYENQFPEASGLKLSKQSLQSATKGLDAVFLSSGELQSKLNANDLTVLVTPYGSAFPKEAESAILNFLRAGGNWVNLGGTPLSVPAMKENGKWVQEPRQVQFHKKLGLTQSFPVSTASVVSYSANELMDGAEAVRGEFKAEEVFEGYYRFTNTKDYPNEDGASGQRDARLDALLWGVDAAGNKLVAPFIQIDRLQGEFTGGRWIFANYRGTISEKGVRSLIDRALQGASTFTVSPTFACYREGEVPAFNVRLQTNFKNSAPAQDVRLVITNESGEALDYCSAKLTGNDVVATGLAVSTAKNWKPGFYRVRASVSIKRGSNIQTSNPQTLNSINGFWVYDSKLISSGSPLTVDANYFYRNGEVYPVTGTTYMASDVARKFMFEPNAAVWREDFAAMKNAGINVIRTGIWNSYKNYMLDAGSVNEQFLRSLDAFILSARAADIPVIFTFFAFLPETWGGENAYLDPRSVNAQQQFLATVAQRYATVNDIAWDLINEPSFCNPNNLWSCRPNYDQFESNAWVDWLKAKYDTSAGASWENTVRKNFRMTTEEPIALPAMEEFADVNIFDQHRPFKVVDYRLFAQDMFKRWVGTMTAALRSNGNPRQLITVGQDEGGTNESPNNQFMSDALDFTSMHNWWLNDDLVWDNVITKAPGKANLLEETGVMFYERSDGNAWRTEQEAADLLERKLAIAFGAGGAGFIEWIWNTNPYMKSDNEAAIGLLRIDGTVKPELSVVKRYAVFFRESAKFMKQKREADVLLVIPHASMFSTRNFATQATKRSVRTLAYRFGVVPQGVSEFCLAAVNVPPKLIVLPSPQLLTQDAWQRLMKLVEGGSTLLVSGAIDRDEHGWKVDRSGSLGVTGTTVAVTQQECMRLNGKMTTVSFRDLKIQRIEKFSTGDTSMVVRLQRGKGTVLWSTLPLELSENSAPLEEFTQLGLSKAGIDVPESNQDISILRLRASYRDADMLFYVSEANLGQTVTPGMFFSLPISTLTTTVPAQRTAVLVIDRSSGKVLSRLQEK